MIIIHVCLTQRHLSAQTSNESKDLEAPSDNEEERNRIKIGNGWIGRWIGRWMDGDGGSKKDQQ